MYDMWESVERELGMRVWMWREEEIGEDAVSGFTFLLAVQRGAREDNDRFASMLILVGKFVP